jgi:hypothetical protein
MKLGGWIRLGIVLSLLWVVISGWAAYECYVGAPFGEFVTDSGRFTPVTSSLDTGVFLKILLIPLVATWIVVAVIVLAVRWVIAGFRG